MTVYDAQLLVVSPKENHVVTGAVDGLQGILRELGEVERLQGQVLGTQLHVPLDFISGREMIRVPEYFDVWMQSFEGMPGVLFRSHQIDLAASERGFTEGGYLGVHCVQGE
jgi:hypothetical protein